MSVVELVSCQSAVRRPQGVCAVGITQAGNLTTSAAQRKSGRPPDKTLSGTSTSSTAADLLFPVVFSLVGSFGWPQGLVAAICPVPDSGFGFVFFFGPQST